VIVSFADDADDRRGRQKREEMEDCSLRHTVPSSHHRSGRNDAASVAYADDVETQGLRQVTRIA
jgi:hypothetical protein